MSDTLESRQPAQPAMPELPAAAAAAPANPFFAMAGNLSQTLKVLVNLNKNTQRARQKVRELQERVERLESTIAESSGQRVHGQRLDKYR